MAVAIYGLMRATDCPKVLDVKSRRGTVAVRGVEHNGLAALVSDLPEGSLRIRRDALLVHSEVLHQAMERGVVLPLRFGEVVPDDDAVRAQVLEPNLDTFAARLDALKGTAEFQLSVSIDSERALELLLAEDKQIAESAQRVRALPEAAGHFERIALGELIAKRVEQWATAVEAEVVAALEPFTEALTSGQRQNEWVAAKLACLVRDERRDEFDAEVDRLAAAHAIALHFKVIGPLPPHSFADHPWEAVAWA